MKNYIIKIFIGLLFITSFSCKSSKTNIVKDVEEKTSTVDNGIEIKGLITKFDDFNVKSNEVEYTKYEPIYYKKNGKDTVELKPITVRKVKKEEKIEKRETIDTTRVETVNEVKTELTDNTTIEREFEGFDIIKSIISGAVAIITGPFSGIIWLASILLAILLIRYIINKFKNKK